MEEKNKKDKPNFVFNFNAPVGQQIANVERMEVHFDKDMKMQVQNVENLEGVMPQPSTPTVTDEEMFHFVHPSVSEAEEWQVHNEVKRLVKSFSMQEICLYLSDMKKKCKVLLPQNMKTAYDELVRMGLPVDREGFAVKTFEKYYRR